GRSGRRSKLDVASLPDHRITRTLDRDWASAGAVRIEKTAAAVLSSAGSVGRNVFDAPIATAGAGSTLSGRLRPARSAVGRGWRLLSARRWWRWRRRLYVGVAWRDVRRCGRKLDLRFVLRAIARRGLGELSWVWRSTTSFSRPVESGGRHFFGRRLWRGASRHRGRR